MSLDLNTANESQFKGVITGVTSMSRRDDVGSKGAGVVEKFMANMPEKYYPKQLQQFIKENSGDPAVEDHIRNYKESHMDKLGLLFSIELESDSNESFSEWVPTPGRRGYSLSNLKKIIDKNGLPAIVIPDEVSEWILCAVWCELNSNNYYRITK